MITMHLWAYLLVVIALLISMVVNCALILTLRKATAVLKQQNEALRRLRA